MSIEETGETRVNDGREERLVRILVGGTPSSEVWITDPENLDGGPEFMQALSELQDLFQDLAGDFMTDGQIAGGDTDIFLGGLPNLDGFPVAYHDLETDEIDRLDSLIWENLDPDAFEPPKGYRLRTMMP